MSISAASSSNFNPINVLTQKQILAVLVYVENLIKSQVPPQELQTALNKTSEYKKNLLGEKKWQALPISQEDRDAARTSDNLTFVARITQSPNYIITDEDYQYARTNFNTLFASRITRNPNWIINDEDYKIARTNRDSRFAGGIAQNPNYIISKEDYEHARTITNSWFTLSVTKNPNYIITEEDRQIARSRPFSWFAQGLKSNPNNPDNYPNINSLHSTLPPKSLASLVSWLEGFITLEGDSRQAVLTAIQEKFTPAAVRGALDASS